MSLEIESSEKYSSDKPTEMDKEARKKTTISYTRDFLLSLSDLDVCKKLPSGLDKSILSEFEDVSQDRQRISSGLSINSYRRIEYGSSPPTRGDVPSFSRGVHGRWESRSSGRSDRDSDSQSDWDSDSGRRNSNQSRRSWHVPEHDGLLGSGSFPRPSGFAAGVSAPKFRPNDHYQLNRSNEPYHPPRPYKAVPHSRRETNDSYNDETFGSSECTSEDRAEEERKRRASFELMRKEQHKSFQEKQRLGLDKSGNDFDITTLMDGSQNEKKLLNRNNKSNDSVAPSTLDNDSENSSVPPHTPASRPLVPPGFTSTILDRNVGAKSVNRPDATEVGNLEIEDNLLDSQSNLVSNGTSNNQVEKQLAEQMVLHKKQHENTTSHASTTNKSESVLDVSSSLDVSSISKDIDGKLYNKSNLGQAIEASNDSETIGLSVETVTGNSLDHSTSILDKLFGSALTLKNGGPSNLLEHQDAKADETRSPQTVHSSKFAHLFLEDEKKHSNDHSPGRSSDLLSLIVGGDKGGSLVTGNKNEKNSPYLPFQPSEPADRVMTSNTISATIDDSEQLNKNNKAETVSAVLTCEDLEQSILLGINENGSSSQPTSQSWSDPDGKAEQQTANIDNDASQHLLSLLQKGTSLNVKESSTTLGTSADSLHAPGGVNTGTAFQNLREVNGKNISDASNALTLETLFGTAFMQELQSVGAPVSIQRAPVGAGRGDISEPRELPFPVTDESVPSTNEIGFNNTVHGSNALIPTKRNQAKADMTDEQWLPFDNPQAGLNNTSQIQMKLGSNVGGFDVPADIPLPEEDSLITVSNPLNLQNFMPSGSSIKTELLSSSNTNVDIAEKLAAFNPVFKDERSARGGQGPPFLRSPYDKRESEIPYQNLNVQPSSAQLQHPQLNNMGPLFHPIDSHPVNMNSQMKFLASEANIHHDPPPNLQIPANMLRPPFHHPSTGLPGFDQPMHHPMLQQMHMQGNFPPNQMLQGLSRGPPLPPHANRGANLPAHPNGQVTGFVQDLNPMPNFPFGQRQSNFGSLGMPPPAHDVGGGSNHPEAFQRLLEMELRANPKHIHPFPTSGHSQGMFGHELDMGFGYR